ncbi:hypothetical protein AMK16_26940 [Streptomyces sp. CB00455]|uniref:DUF6545 domain-containing protein n=1 Tax=Streptomyces sp. CB00455 TaxID=1703927 RepID=UPI000938E82F|nr:DUF6545 domain-containing protein [Streptomyces sp. CB00455]OKK16287.1 hypothetical protein AMK16_26940 [Streptomyces sp. CB00455]
MTVDEGVNNYMAAAVIGVVLLAKLPALMRGWRRPMVRGVNGLLALGGAAHVFSAPPTIVALNRFTGISNFSAPLVYCILAAYSCTSLVLMENWRADSTADTRTRRRIRVWTWTCCPVAAAIVVCFSLGEAPVERTKDFDTYYATTPYIREMIVLYLLTHTVTACATAVLCWTWARRMRQQVRGARDTRASVTVRSLRIGLSFLIFAFLANTAFGVLKLGAVLRRWSGGDWDALNEVAQRFIPFNAIASMIGFLLPVFAPWLIERVWRPWCAFASLGPLWRTVRSPDDAKGRRALAAAPWRFSPEQLLVYRMTGIRDEMLRLRAYCDDDVREDARREAAERGADEGDAVVLGLAAMFQAAAADRARRTPVGREQSTRAAAALLAAESGQRELMTRMSRAMKTWRSPRPASASLGPAGAR